MKRRPLSAWDRWIAVCLLFYPRRFRERFGDDLTAQYAPPGNGRTIRAGLQATRDLVRGGVISGTVVDGEGHPLRRSPITLVPLANPTPINPQVMTDDRGVYRAFGLLPGEWIVLSASQRWSVGTPLHTTTDEEARWAEQLARELRKLLGHEVRVRPVIAVPGWEIDAQASVQATARCEGEVNPGSAMVMCQGGCEVEASAEVDCGAEADLKCTATAPSIACEGTCRGSCTVEGSAAANCSSPLATASAGDDAASTVPVYWARPSMISAARSLSALPE